MSERLILELKSKFRNELQIEEERRKDDFEINDIEIKEMMGDLQLTLKSLNYTNNEIKGILPIIIKQSGGLTKKDKNSSFENLLKLAMNYLDNDSSNLVR